MRRFIPHIAVFLVTCAGLIELAVNGFAFESACDPGFGARYAAAQDRTLRHFFTEPLPQKIQVVTLECGGFQDHYVNATFRIAAADAKRLIAALDDTYHAVHNHRELPDKDKRRHVMGFPGGKQISYRLPPPPFFHSKEVTVRVPESDTAPATVVFSVQQM